MNPRIQVKVYDETGRKVLHEMIPIYSETSIVKQLAEQFVKECQFIAIRTRLEREREATGEERHVERPHRPADP